MTLICKNCNEKFDEENVRWEKNKVGTTGMFEEFPHCPDCDEYLEDL